MLKVGSFGDFLFKIEFYEDDFVGQCIKKIDVLRVLEHILC